MGAGRCEAREFPGLLRRDLGYPNFVAEISVSCSAAAPKRSVLQNVSYLAATVVDFLAGMVRVQTIAIEPSTDAWYPA